LEAADVSKNEFLIPKFVFGKENIRKVFIEKHRDLFRRFDGQLMEELEVPNPRILEAVVSDSETEPDLIKGTEATFQK